MNRDTETDVIVIGGGFAGVIAARELGTRGLRVLLLEARNRLGGRTWYETNRIEGFDVEMGGGWLGRDEAFAMAEVERYGIPLIATEEVAPEYLLWRSETGVRRSVIPVPFGQLADLERAIGRMNEAASQIHDGAFAAGADMAALKALDVSLPAFFADLNLPSETAGVLEGWWTGMSSSHWSEMSALLLARLIAHSGQTFMGFAGTVMLGPRFKNGTGELINAAIAESNATVVLNAPVRTVESHDDGVRVTANGTSYAAKAAICAAPINTLGGIAFEPPLSKDKQEGIAIGHSGKGFKLWMVAKHVSGGVFCIGAPGPFNHLFTVDERDDLALLVAFGYGDCPDIADLNAINASLREYLPQAEVIKADAHDWRRDAFAQGTWAVFPPGYITQFEQVMRRPHGRVYFAGADLSETRPGYIDGAIESGIATARSVMTDLAL